MAEAPKLRKYELIYIVQPEATDEGKARVDARVREVIERFEGKLLRREEWGKRKLAYEIRKFAKGIFYYFVFAAPPGTTREIERNLRMLDDCMRYQTIKLDDNITPEMLEAEPVIDDAKTPDDDADETADAAAADAAVAAAPDPAPAAAAPAADPAAQEADNA